MILRANSWTIISEGEVLKKLDKSALLHKGTGIPKKIRFFFEIKEMSPGENRSVILIYNGKKYNAKFNMESVKTARTRLLWYTDFEEVLNRVFREEYNHLASGKEIGLENKSSIVLHKVAKDKYIVKLICNTQANRVNEQDDSVLYDFAGICRGSWGNEWMSVI